MLAAIWNFTRRLTLWLAVYSLVYFAYRQTHIEVWPRDRQPYVIFESEIPYYIFRPASYVDAHLTGMRFHIGPHRDDRR